MRMPTNNGSADNFHLANALKAFFLNYVLTFLAGVAGALIFSIAFPVREIVFSLYIPFDFFVRSYFFACFAVFLLTIIYWLVFLVFRRKNFFQLVVPYILAFIFLVVAGLMRSGTLIPNDIAVQFVLFFSAVLLTCQALIVHAVMMMLTFMRKAGLIKS